MLIITALLNILNLIDLSIQLEYGFHEDENNTIIDKTQGRTYGGLLIINSPSLDDAGMFYGKLLKITNQISKRVVSKEKPVPVTIGKVAFDPQQYEPCKYTAMQSACNPRPDSTLCSVEFFSDKEQIPEHYTSRQEKEVVELEAGGFLVVPPYAVIQRISVEENPDSPSGIDKQFWEDYRGVAIDWGNAFSKFKQLQKEMKLSWKDFLFPAYLMDKAAKLGYWHRKMLYHYGRVQEADLYAHFSPVGFITDTDLLKENSPDFTDALGPESVWKRITKAGEDKFYRVDYEDNQFGKTLTEEQKRMKEKKLVEEDGLELLISTNIATTSYIRKVIKAYVEGDQETEKQLYHEPDKHQP